jgi:short-subunit dehydrogenase
MTQDIALITGASSGIGEAFAKRLARDGRHLALVARRGDRLQALATDIQREHGVTAHCIAMDLTKPGAGRELSDEVERRGLAVDWLVNNAGFGTQGRIDRLPVEKELEEIQLNVAALVDLTGRFTPAMVQRGRGAVINISSVGGFAPGPYMATYCATKAFVLSFTEAIATELRETGVKVLCVCPGFTRTAFQDVAAVDATSIPSFAWMSAEDVADQAVRAVGRGPVLVNGFMNGVMVRMMRFMPHALTNRVTESMLKHQSA